MNPNRNPERDHARGWDTQSNLSSIKPQPARKPVPSTQSSRNQASANTGQNSTTQPTPRPGFGSQNGLSHSNHGQKSQSIASRSGGVSFNGQPAASHQRSRAPAHRQQRGRRHMHNPIIWKSVPALETNRRADAIVLEKVIGQADEMFLQSPIGEEFETIGYYMWPSNEAGGSPGDVLGDRLEELDNIRKHRETFIALECNNRLKICCRERTEENSRARLHEVIREIREVIRHRRAIQFAAEPTHILVPPTENAITTFIHPDRKFRDPDTSIDCPADLQLGNTKLSGEEKSKYSDDRAGHLEKYRRTFEEAITKGLRELSSYKGLMQMRLQFGRAILQRAPKELMDKGLNWKDFVYMADYTHVSSQMDSRMYAPGLVTLFHEKVLTEPKIFGLADGGYNLNSIPVKDTEIVFFTRRGVPMRIEAELDRVSEYSTLSYQVGTTRLFQDHERNKRMRVTSIDVENELDWCLEIIAGTQVPLSAELMEKVKKTVNTLEPVQYDELGFPFPNINPIARIGIMVTKLLIKTTFEYALVDSGYIVEISVYRERVNFLKQDVDISVGFSIYHPDWDVSMKELHSTSDTRPWDNPLKEFFNHNPSQGVDTFFCIVEKVQGLLADAISQYKAEYYAAMRAWSRPESETSELLSTGAQQTPHETESEHSAILSAAAQPTPHETDSEPSAKLSATAQPISHQTESELSASLSAAAQPTWQEIESELFAVLFAEAQAASHAADNGRLVDDDLHSSA